MLASSAPAFGLQVVIERAQRTKNPPEAAGDLRFGPMVGVARIELATPTMST